MMERKLKIRKNDTVEVIAGSEKGKRGAVLRVLREKNRLIVQGINMGKKALRKRSQQDQGGIAEIEMPIHISNVMVVGKKSGASRIGYKFDGDKKVRICRKGGEVL
jgi:ribosomal protein L24